VGDQAGSLAPESLPVPRRLPEVNLSALAAQLRPGHFTTRAGHPAPTGKCIADALNSMDPLEPRNPDAVSLEDLRHAKRPLSCN